MMKKYLWLILITTVGSTQAQVFDEMLPLGDFFEDVHLSEQQQLADQQEQQQKTYELLQHNFFENERWRIYNHSAYSTKSLQEKWQDGNLEELHLADLSLAFGYGVEYFLDHKQSVGYEYLSNFPDDYGQMIRFFWNKSF